VKLALAIPSATLHVTEGDHYLSAADREEFVAVLDEACTLVARRRHAIDDARRAVGI
jgi:hypothetical protein